MEDLDPNFVSHSGLIMASALHANENVFSSMQEVPQIAIVAPAPKRTIKFLQGLATLGRVPLVHPVWLIDSCLLAAGQAPIATTPDVVFKFSKFNIQPIDLPLELLRLSARTIYELPRGVDKSTGQYVPP